jgi:hypothetical protein
MITPPTTFVVGAGASRAYGLPVAWAVCKAAKGLIAGNDVYQLLYCILKDTAILDRVLDDLRQYGGPDSIDAFLEHRQHDEQTMLVGKLLIAGLLGSAIARRTPIPAGGTPNGNWIRHIIAFMARGISQAAHFASAARNVAFITFDFDSVIEERSVQVIRSIYNGVVAVRDRVASVLETAH